MSHDLSGETPELQRVEHSEHQDHFQPNHQRVSKPTNEQTRQTREKRNTTNKNLGTSKSTKSNKPRNNGREKGLTKMFPTKVDRNPQRKEGTQKQPRKDEPEDPTQVPNQSFRATTPSDPELESFGMMETENSRNMEKPVSKTVAEKLHRSRLVPPQSAKDIILRNRAIVQSLFAAGKLNSPSERKQKTNVPGGLEKEASPPDTDFEQNQRSAVDLMSQSKKDNNTMSSSERDPRAEGVLHIPALREELGTLKIINQISGNCSKMKEPFDRLVVNQEQGLQSAEETTVSMTGVSDLQSSETQEKPEGVFPSLPERSETSGIFHNQRIHEPVQAEARPECPESKTSVPEDMWTSLEKTVQEMLQGLANKPGFVVEISRIFSEILVSLHRWTLDLENTLKHSTRNESSPRDGPESFHHGFLREPNVTDKNLQPEAEGSGHSSWIKASSASVGMTEPTDSRSKVGLAVEDHHVGEEMTSIEQDTASSLEDKSKTSPGEQTDTLVNMSEEVVFIDSHFAEPFPTKTESRSEQGLRDSSSTKPESHLVKDPKDLRSHTLSSSSNAGQSSAVKRLIEVTAEELRAIAVPELDLWSLQEGKLVEETKTCPLEEVSVGDMDSCEEADEEEEEDDNNVLQPASEQERVAGDSTQNPEEEPEDVPLDQRKEDCRVS